MAMQSIGNLPHTSHRIAAALLPAAHTPPSTPADAVQLGAPSEALPKRPQVPSPAAESTRDQLLRSMRPFIRKAYVVSPGGANGAPPILGGHGPGTSVPLPEELRGIPSHRWVCTPEIAAFHRENLSHQTNAELRAEDGNELEPVAIPLLQRRYGDREGLAVAELGPATSTVVPRALAGKVNHYFATDLSLPLLERERDLVNEPGYLLSGSYQVQGDTYDLPYENGSMDVMFTSCHPPFVSSSPGERIQAFGEVARVLKDGGEFVLFPFDRDKQPPAVMAFIDRNFQQVDAAPSPYGSDREMVVLRKK